MKSKLLTQLFAFLRPPSGNSQTPYATALDRLLSSSSSMLPHELFKNASDDFWIWLNTEGYRTDHRLQKLLPGLPPEYFQGSVAQHLRLV